MRSHRCRIIIDRQNTLESTAESLIGEAERHAASTGKKVDYTEFVRCHIDMHS
ncbi:hypothetical protein D3C84_1207580 [compost metagenome]